MERPDVVLAAAIQDVGANEPETMMATTRPNIVFVMVDDMRADMVEDLPRLKAMLTERGLSFTSAYTAAPSCCPARASILRGQFPHNTGVFANMPPQGGFQTFRRKGNEASTMATWLRDAGYRTALIGKYLNEYETALKHVPPGWRRWFVYGGKGKFNKYRVSDQGKIRDYGKGKKKKHYQTDVLAKKATKFIRTTSAGQPLFLYLAPSAPHEPATPAQRHKKAKLTRGKAPRLPSYNEADVSDKPGIGSRLRRMNGSGIRKADHIYVKQLKSMLAVEDMIRRVIDALELTNRLENTYIVFTSDNGYHHGEHRLPPGKGSPFEESIRAPLIVVGPGVPAGETHDAMVSLIDLAPTFAEWAGVESPEFVDGRSIAGLVGGATPPGWRDTVFAELPRARRGGFKTIRKDDYVYTAYSNGERELYDLSVDPYQLDNIAGSASQALLNQLQDRLEALARCSVGSTSCQEADGGG